MRKRKEIAEEFNEFDDGLKKYRWRTLVLEILLDIRESLEKGKKSKG